MNKRGIELAASFIVVLIVSIIMLGLAGGITYKIFCASGEKIEQLDSQTERLVEQKLASGSRVTIPLPTKEVRSVANFCGEDAAPGAVFGLGIRNDLIQNADFQITCDAKGVEDPNGALTPSANPIDCDADWQFDRGDISIPSREKVTRLLVLNVPGDASDGKHVFTFTVNDVTNGQQYGAANVYVVVS